MSEFERMQRSICERYGSPFVAAESDSKTGIAVSTLGSQPLNAMRTQPGELTEGISGAAKSSLEIMTFWSLFIRDTCPDTVPRSSSTLLSVQGGAFFSVRNERTFGSMRNLSIHLPAFERTSCSRLHEEAITTSGPSRPPLRRLLLHPRHNLVARAMTPSFEASALPRLSKVCPYLRSIQGAQLR